MSKLRIGGQAVLEGVMMRGTEIWAVAVRTPDGNISTQSHDLNPIVKRYPFLKLFLLRGIIALVESLVVGIKALIISADESMQEEEITSKEIALSFAIAILFAVGLFIFMPLWVTRLFVSPSNYLFYWIEGLLRIAVFIAYIAVVSLLKDLRRVFEYHGAEHMVIHAFEHDAELAPGQIRQFSPLHVRCGTSFLLIVMVVAIVFFTLVGKGSLPLLVLSRIVGIPLIAAVSYEIIRFAGRHESNSIIRVIMFPGVALQRLTTRRPSDEQLEVAISALKSVIERDRGETENLSMP